MPNQEGMNTIASVVRKHTITPMPPKRTQMVPFLIEKSDSRKQRPFLKFVVRFS